MEFEEGELPVSPTGQYLNSSTLNFTIIAILEFEVPIDDLHINALLKDLFLPISPRFSSIMIGEKNEERRWKPVQVQLEEHVKVAKFPQGKSPEFYDEYLDDYVSNMGMERLAQSRPLWEVHVINYQTSNAAGNVIFKLHHSLGDGYSLIGLLLSCLERADNPSLPLTFPSLRSKKISNSNSIMFGLLPPVFLGIINTILDFGWGILKKKDDRTPIRSENEAVEVGPRTITTITFSLDQIKQIKDTLKLTINDVITGIVLYGTRMYMQEESYESRNANSTALMAFNTRNIVGYNSVSDMIRPNLEKLWGNKFTLSQVPIPKFTSVENSSNPLHFIQKIHKIIERKKNSSAVYITGSIIENVGKFRGPEAAAKLIHTTLKNSSIALSNLIGPVEQMALANHPIKGFYFTLAGAPVSLGVAIVSYMGNLRVAITSEKGYIDAQKLKSCILKAFDMISEIILQSNSDNSATIS